jgi:hypothetical protein
LHDAQAGREEDAARAQAECGQLADALDATRAELASMHELSAQLQEAAQERCAAMDAQLQDERRRAEDAEHAVQQLQLAEHRAAHEAAAAAAAVRNAPVDSAALRAALTGVEMALEAQRRELERKDADLAALHARAAAMERRAGAAQPPTLGEAALAAARAAAALDAVKARLRAAQVDASAAAERAAAELFAERARTRAAEEAAAAVPRLEEALRAANARAARAATQQRVAAAQLEQLRAGDAGGPGPAAAIEAEQLTRRLAAAEAERDGLAAERDRLRRTLHDFRAATAQRDAAAADASAKQEAAHAAAARRAQAALAAAEQRVKSAQAELRDKEAALLELRASLKAAAQTHARVQAERDEAGEACLALRARLTAQEREAEALHEAAEAASRASRAALAEAGVRAEASGALLAATRALASRLISLAGTAWRCCGTARGAPAADASDADPTRPRLRGDGAAALGDARALLRSYCSALDAALCPGAGAPRGPQWRGELLDSLLGLVAALSDDAHGALEAAAPVAVDARPLLSARGGQAGA